MSDKVNLGKLPRIQTPRRLENERPPEGTTPGGEQAGDAFGRVRERSAPFRASKGFDPTKSPLMAGAVLGRQLTDEVRLPRDVTVPIPKTAAIAVSGREIQDALRDYSRALAMDFRFDHFTEIADLIGFLQQHGIELGEKSPEVAERALRCALAFPVADPVVTFKESGGGNCLHLAAFAASDLTRQGLIAKVVPSSASDSKADAGFNHAAAALSFANPDDPADRGHVLIDPALSMEPLVIRAGETITLTEADRVLRLTSKEVDGEVRIESERTRMVDGAPRNTVTGTYFVEREWTNLRESGLLRAMLHDPLPRLSVKDADGHTKAGIGMMTRGEKLDIYAYDEAEGPKHSRLKFSQVAEAIDRGGAVSEAMPIDDAFAAALGEDRLALLRDIRGIITATRLISKMRSLIEEEASS